MDIVDHESMDGFVGLMTVAYVRMVGRKVWMRVNDLRNIAPWPDARRNYQAREGKSAETGKGC
tara:strand:+ start:437 stop:625 length:189 start_codon:yes stop_codon:yes gene_type:complete